MLEYTKLERLPRDKHSLLLVSFITYEELFVNTAPDCSSGQDHLFGNPVCLYTAHLPVAVKPGDCLHLHH
jgi:hypothetical protein